MKRIHSNSEFHQKRRGIAVLWLIIWGSLFLTFFCVVLEIATLWQAQVEVQNSLDSAALAAVKEWGASGSGSTAVPRDAGVAYAAANPILGSSMMLTTNYDPSDPINNPNENLNCTGNFIFGALTTPTAPFTFDAGESASTAVGTVFMEIVKNNSGNGVGVRDIGVFFDDGGANLSIRTIEFTIPLLGNSISQQPYFNATLGSEPALSTAFEGPDALNRNNPTGFDYRGLDIDPNLISGNWYCDPTAPPFTLMGMNTNPDGDICFEMDNQVPFGTNRYRTLIVHFTDGAFVSTMDPATTDFFRFGVSMNQLNNPPLPGGNNDGESWHLAPVTVSVTFYNNLSMTTSTATTAFVDDGNPANGRSIATLSSIGGIPAVRAQATVPVQGFCSSMFGISFLDVTAKSTAYFDSATGRPALVHVENEICP